MIYLLYGEDDLSLKETLATMKASVQPAELRDFNITTLSGAMVGFDQLAATCDTVPFLAEKRMVVVEGLLATFEPRPPARGGVRAAPAREPRLGQWEALADYLSRVPQSTDLVFVEGLLRGANPLLAKLRPVAETLTFPLPPTSQLSQWIRQQAAKRGIEIEPGAASALAEVIGRNPRMIDQELQKLSLYRRDQVIRRQDVQELVAYVREASIFAAVDAVVEGRAGVALRSIHQLLESGARPSYLITMLARQVRFLLMAKELLAQRLPRVEIGKRLALTGYPLTKTLEQAPRLTAGRLAEIHRKLLEADVTIKTGGASEEELVLDVLVAELASPPRRG